MDITELDGEYEVTMQSNIHELAPGFYDFGKALVTVSGGTLQGVDSGGITWSGTLTVAPDGADHDVIANIDVDPRTGRPDAKTMQHDGQIRRERVSHEVPLNLTRVGDKVILRGELRIGAFVTVAIIRRL